MTTPFDDDKMHEECGIFGIYGDDDAAARTALGLHALQHRGQEAAGLVSFDGEQFTPTGTRASSATSSPAKR
jgi:amidophosphoribosyltransferase